MGHEPVREWLLSLEASARREIGSDIRRVQWRWPIGKPLVEGLGGGLYEVRTFHRGNSYRVFFCIDARDMILLQGILK
jgi:phage-related protein